MRLFIFSGALIFLATVILDLRAGAMAGGPTLPSGTVLFLHLQTAVSTKTAQQGQSITAAMAREVEVPGGVAVPYGSVLKGTIGKCTQPTTADERAELLLSFGEITIPGQGTLTLNGHLSGVSNAREKLQADGTIEGVLESDTPASLLSGALQKLGQANSTINDQIQKQKIGQVNTAVELPVGADLQFTLTAPLALKRFAASAGPAGLSPGLRASMESVLADAPKRAESKTNKPGDPINLVVIGTRQEILQAFQKAGWYEPKKKTQQSIFKTAEAVIDSDAYDAAPVSDLYLFGRKEDLAFEKTLNTFNKRHHLRLWSTSATASNGRPIWLAAATHDTGIAIYRGGISHATDSNLDDERAQVESDLFLGGDVQGASLLTPPNPLSNGMTATGGAWHTDGRLFVIDLKGGA